MMQKSLLSLVIILLFTPKETKAQLSDSLSTGGFELEKKIDSIVVNAINHRAFPGCVVYAKSEDSILFFKSYGHHTYDSLREVEKSNLYDLASVTKVTGATLALMKLYDDGLIHLDDPISKYVDKLGGNVGKVTIREALAHQGGLYPWIPYYQEMKKRNGRFKSKSVSNKKDAEYNFQLSDSLFLHKDFYTKIKKMIRRSQVKKNPTYRYSGLFFYLIPEMVKSLTGMEYETYLEEKFYNPLGASTLGFNPLDRFDKDMIVPTEVDSFFRMTPIHGLVHDEGAIMMKGVSGNAGLFSNVEDLSKVWEMWLEQGRVDTTQYLSPQTIELFTTAHFPNQENRRGLGFDKPLLEYDSLRSSVAKDASFRSYGHTGYTGTLVWSDPDNSLLYIFLSNRVYPTRKNGALYDLNVRPTIHQLFYDYLKSSDLSESGNKQ